MEYEKVLKALAEDRSREVAVWQNAQPLSHAGGLTFSRARVLALDPSRADATESEHLQQCRLCASLVQGFDLAMVHPTWWFLLRWVFGLLSRDEAGTVLTHLQEEGCPQCRSTVDMLEQARQSVATILTPVQLPHPDLIQGEVDDPPDVRVSSLNKSLEVRLVHDDDQVVLLLRSRQPELWNTVYKYHLCVPEGGHTSGFLVLQDDVNQWVAAKAVFPLEKLIERLGGRRVQVLACPILQPLTEVDRETLADSLQWRLSDEQAKSLNELLAKLG